MLLATSRIDIRISLRYKDIRSALIFFQCPFNMTYVGQQVYAVSVALLIVFVAEHAGV